MEAKIKHFSEVKNSMIQSAVNEQLTTQAAGQGLNSEHEQIHLLNKVLDVAPSQADKPHEGFLEHVKNWVKHLVDKGELLLMHSDYAVGFTILEQYVAALLDGNTKLAAQKKADLKFSDCDPHWVDTIVTWFNYYENFMRSPQYVAYKSLDDFAYALPPTATGTLRVGLVGDWGTGEGRAITVLDQMFALKPDLIIHLGDVYYSGTKHEYQVNYEDIINQARHNSGLNIPVYNLPGNHDYYSGGHAFYDSLKTVNNGVTPPMPVQEASYFALFNDAWQLQGMDTGYYDNDVLKVALDTTHLKDEEVLWHHHQLDKAVAAGRKVILLSHHQLFSRYQAIADQTHNEDLLRDFQTYIGQGNISAWFWGHEHLMAIYAHYLGLDKGRCLGNGAVPIFYNGGAPYAERASVKGVPLPNLPEEQLAPAKFQNDGEVYFQGFALLELHADKTGKAYYYTTDQPTPIYEEDLG